MTNRIPSKCSREPWLSLKKATSLLFPSMAIMEAFLSLEKRMVSQVKSRSLFPPRIILKRRPSAHIAASTTNGAGDPFRSVGQGSFPVFSARGRAGAAADAKPTVDRRPKMIFLPPFHSNKTVEFTEIYTFCEIPCWLYEPSANRCPPP